MPEFAVGGGESETLNLTEEDIAREFAKRHAKIDAACIMLSRGIRKISCYGFWALLLVAVGVRCGIVYCDNQSSIWLKTTTELGRFQYKGTNYEVRPCDIQPPPSVSDATASSLTSPSPSGTAATKKKAN